MAENVNKDRKQSKFTMDTVPYLLLYLAAILIVGMIDVVDAQFNPLRILTADYWIEVGMMTVANTLVLTSSTNISINKLLLIDPVVLDLNKNIAIAKPKLQPDFTLYVHDLNMDRKTQAYLTLMHNKIEKLNKRASHKSKILWLRQERAQKKLEDIEYPYPEFTGKVFIIKWIKKQWHSLWNQRSIKYFRNMKQLKSEMTPEYLKDNIEMVKVKYPMVKESFIKNGVNTKSTTYDFVVQSDASKKFQDLAPAYLRNIGIGAFMASFFLGPQDGITQALIVSISFKMMILIMNWNRGRQYAPKFIIDKIVGDLQYRLDKMLDYISKKKKEVKPNGENVK